VARSEVKEVVIQRWRDAIPQFLAHGVDARRRAALSEALRGRTRGVGGRAYGAGVGVPDCIASGLDAADAIRRELAN
jgi:protoporphyrinogen oxidase